VNGETPPRVGNSRPMPDSQAADGMVRTNLLTDRMIHALPSAQLAHRRVFSASEAVRERATPIVV